MTCKVKGEPVPEITWYYDGQPIKTDDIYKVVPGEVEGESTLQIPEIFPEDAGAYTVKATNEAGEVESTAVITVTGNEPLPVYNEFVIRKRCDDNHKSLKQEKLMSVTTTM